MIDLKTIPARYERYYTYIEPVMVDPIIRGYFSLVASFILVAFFVIFALSPTVNTILSLNKKISDQKITITALDAKIAALISAQQNYSQVENFLPLVDTALPKKPMVQTAVNAIFETASTSAVTVSGLQFKTFTLFGGAPPTTQTTTDLADMVPQGLLALPFSLSFHGSANAPQSYLEKLQNSLRYIRFQSLSVSRQKDNLTTNIDAAGFTYYYPSP